jgi:hypothetical protein
VSSFPAARLIKYAHHWVTICHHLLQLSDESVIDGERRLEIVEFDDANRGRLANVRVVVSEALAQRVAEVVEDLLGAEAAHGSDGEGTDEGVGVVGVLSTREGVSFCFDERRWVCLP